jgi:hypothetical protein
LKPIQARRLIGQLMQWTDDEATRGFQWLDLMAQYKFDHYQGYGPGRRFYLTLLRWLSQFGLEDRRVAFRLLHDHLTFISQAEMHHLVSRSGALIQRKMRAHVAKLCGVPVHEVDLDPLAKRRLELLQTRTLYVGASDGARIDVFRRFNEGTINNEQVVATNEISGRKWKDLHEKLAERIAVREDFHGVDARFEWVCLIDDFSASATSSILEENGKWKGKVVRFLDGPPERAELPLMDGAVVLIHHYLGTATADEKIGEACKGIGRAHPALQFMHSFAYVLPPRFSMQHCGDAELLDLIRRHFDEKCGDKIVGYKIPFGYKEGGLPLVLEHNTPNNAIALLWAASPPDTDSPTPVVPLFPRRKRHMEIR